MCTDFSNKKELQRQQPHGAAYANILLQSYILHGVRNDFPFHFVKRLPYREMFQLKSSVWKRDTVYVAHKSWPVIKAAIKFDLNQLPYKIGVTSDWYDVGDRLKSSDYIQSQWKFRILYN